MDNNTMAKNIAFWQKENDFGKKQGQLTLEEEEEAVFVFSNYKEVIPLYI